MKDLKVATAEQMREIDHKAIKEYGIPGIVLMENASLGIINEMIKEHKTLENKNIIVFAGTGNNGGDALGAARHAYNAGANVLVILVGSDQSVKGEALINLNIIKKMGINLVVVEDDSFNEEIIASLIMADIVVDGLLGTGINKPVNGLMAKIISIINNANRYTLSIDAPSGINVTTGEICGICIRAAKTIALALPKVGTIIGEGAKFSGSVEVSDIGIPSRIIQESKIDSRLITSQYISDLVPGRSKFVHKGDNGRVLVIAGSIGLTGAAVLASRAAQRAGSGLVTLGIPETLNGILEAKLTEEMTIPLADAGDGILSEKCTNKLESIIDQFDAVAYGPGLGRRSDITEITKWIIRNCPVPLIIDSDGINSLAGNIDLLKEAVCPVVLTPHMGEMARLTGLSIGEIQKDRIKVLRDYCIKLKCTIVLKDWRTVICNKDGQIFINTTGNQGMASGGMGDALTGIIASFAGRGLSVEDAAVAGVYLHGLAGDLTAQEKGFEGITAGDIIEMVPYALRRLS